MCAEAILHSRVHVIERASAFRLALFFSRKRDSYSKSDRAVLSSAILLTSLTLAPCALFSVYDVWWSCFLSLHRARSTCGIQRMRLNDHRFTARRRCPSATTTPTNQTTPATNKIRTSLNLRLTFPLVVTNQKPLTCYFFFTSDSVVWYKVVSNKI